MIIKNSEFSISSPTIAKCPNDTKNEYAFIGRSNVGKSSLINMLCNHKGLAKTSAKPGKTLLIIAQYLLQRKQLVNVFVLIDIRHEQQKIDREFIDWLGKSNIPFSIVFTKADKLSVGKAKANAAAWMKKLEDTWEEMPPYFVTSSESKLGREEVLDYIGSINAELAGETLTLPEEPIEEEAQEPAETDEKAE